MTRMIYVSGLLTFAAIVVWSLGAMAGEECSPAGGLSFICGPIAAEDLVQMPGTHWIIGSGMIGNSRSGALYLIDADKKNWEVLYPSTNPRNELDSKSYGSCPDAPDVKTFGAHGIALRDDGNRTGTLLAVNHGREAVEVFKLDATATKPAIRWVGCVPMSKDVSLNSVAFLPGGGFVATKFYDPGTPEGFRAIFAHKLTGGVLEWHPETGVTPIAGTELTGANGIEASRDGKTLYVAAWGTQELVRFVRNDHELQKTVVKVDFSPDNFRWAPDGMILVAGQNSTAVKDGGIPAFKGWTVAKLDPKTMKATEILKDGGESPLQNASVAIDADGTLWIGAFSGNRVAYKPLK